MCVAETWWASCARGREEYAELADEDTVRGLERDREVLVAGASAACVARGVDVSSEEMDEGDGTMWLRLLRVDGRCEDRLPGTTVCVDVVEREEDEEDEEGAGEYGRGEEIDADRVSTGGCGR